LGNKEEVKGLHKPGKQAAVTKQQAAVTKQQAAVTKQQAAVTKQQKLLVLLLEVAQLH
jgi:hypothetical protein